MERTEFVIQAGAIALSSWVFFNQDDPELVTAWNRSDVDAIEKNLRDAHISFQRDWDAALAEFNRITLMVNAQKSTLEMLIGRYEPQLKALGIDYRKLPTKGGKRIAGEKPTFVFKPQLLERLNYARAATSGITKAVNNGNVGAAIIGTAVALGITWWNQSKIKRRLKDAQGNLAEQAEAARGDMLLLRTRLETHALPFYRDIRDCALKLASVGEWLRTAPAAQADDDLRRKRAMELAMAMSSAKSLLKSDAA